MIKHSWFINFKQDLLPNTAYRIDMAGLRDIFGGAAVETISFQITTDPSSSNAKIASSNPKNGAAEISVDGKEIVVVFDRKMNPDTLTPENILITSPPIYFILYLLVLLYPVGENWVNPIALSKHSLLLVLSHFTKAYLVYNSTFFPQNLNFAEIFISREYFHLVIPN